MGSSHDPGTDCTTMLGSLTPEARSFDFVPARSLSIIAVEEGQMLVRQLVIRKFEE